MNQCHLMHFNSTFRSIHTKCIDFVYQHALSSQVPHGTFQNESLISALKKLFIEVKFNANIKDKLYILTDTILCS